MALVVDASAILGLVFPGENAAYAIAALDTINADQALVPTLFWFELRNALLMGERRKRISANQTALFLDNLNALPFEIDYQPREASLLALARHHSLTVYDATYLELAQRTNLPLVTTDDAIAKAAKALDLAVWKAP